MANIAYLYNPDERVHKMSYGSIEVYRCITEQPWYKNSEYKAVFFHLLIKAASKPNTVNFRGCDIALEAGQLASSYTQLEKELGLSSSLIQRALKKFEQLDQISRESFNEKGRKFTIFTLNNWLVFNGKTPKNSDNVIDMASDRVLDQTRQDFESDSNNVTDTVPDTQNLSTKVDKDHIEPSKVVLPLKAKDKTHNITQTDLDEFISIYSAIDVLHECRKMYLWLKHNPAKRKTAKGIMRFVNGWLSNQDHNARNPKNIISPTGDIDDMSWAVGLEVQCD